MLNENLKIIRKQKGLSQEELAIRLNVVRQTVSKWEKGLSVPDADMLTKIADVFEVPVSQLLGAMIIDNENKNEIADQLVRINEQFAIKNGRIKTIIKVVLGVIIGIIVLNLLLIVIGTVSLDNFKTETNSEVIEIVE